MLSIEQINNLEVYVKQLEKMLGIVMRYTPNMPVLHNRIKTILAEGGKDGTSRNIPSDT